MRPRLLSTSSLKTARDIRQVLHPVVLLYNLQEAAGRLSHVEGVEDGIEDLGLFFCGDGRRHQHPLELRHRHQGRRNRLELDGHLFQPLWAVLLDDHEEGLGIREGSETAHF